MGRARLEAFTLHQTVLGTVPSTVKCYSVNGAIVCVCVCVCVLCGCVKARVHVRGLRACVCVLLC